MANGRRAVSIALSAESIAAGGLAFGLCADHGPGGAVRLALAGVLLAGSGVCATMAGALARGQPVRGGLVEGLMALTVPLVGAVAAAIVTLVSVAMRQSGPSTVTWNPAEAGVSRQGLFDWRTAAALERELKSGPVEASLRNASVEKVQEAFIRLWRGNAASDFDLLSRALDHANRDIRLMARVLMIRLMDGAVASLEEARREAEASPGRAEPRKRAARACVLLSRLNREPETAREFRLQAARWMNEALRLDPADDKTLLEAAAVMLIDDPGAARESFRNILRGRPGDLRALAGSAECACLLGEREALRADCDAILERAPEGSPERAAAEFLMEQMEEPNDECWVDA